MTPTLPANPTVHVRLARSIDASELSSLLGELGFPASAEQTASRFTAAQQHGTAIFAAECDGRLVGFTSLHLVPLVESDGFLGRLTSLVVSSAHRRRGIGRQLVLAAESYAWTHGCVRIEITSGDHRPDAHAFYERIGYELSSRRFLKRHATLP